MDLMLLILYYTICDHKQIGNSCTSLDIHSFEHI